MIDFETPEAVGLVCGTIDRFVDERLLPLEQEVCFDDERIPRDRRRELRVELQDLGLLDLQAPEADGGGGFGQRDMVAVAEARGTVFEIQDTYKVKGPYILKLVGMKANADDVLVLKRVTGARTVELELERSDFERDAPLSKNLRKAREEREALKKR